MSPNVPEISGTATTQYAYTVTCLKNDPLKCWEPLKPVIPQREDETRLSVMVAKAERNYWMVQGSILNTGTMGNQQPSPEQWKVQRLLREQVHCKRLAVEVEGPYEE